MSDWISAVKPTGVRTNSMTAVVTPVLDPHARLTRGASNALRQQPLLLATMVRFETSCALPTSWPTIGPLACD